MCSQASVLCSSSETHGCLCPVQDWGCLWGPCFIPEQALVTPSHCCPGIWGPTLETRPCWGKQGAGCPCKELHAAVTRRSRGSLVLSVSACARARACAQEQEHACWHRLTAEGDRGQRPALHAHSGAFGEEHRRSSLHGGRPLHGHQPPPWCSLWRRVAGNTAVLFIYLLRLDQVRGAWPGRAFWATAGSHSPLAQAVSHWSCTLLKPDLAWGTPGQQPAQNSAQTVGKERAPSSQARDGLALIASVLAPAGDRDALRQQQLLSREPRGDASAGDGGGSQPDPL